MHPGAIVLILDGVIIGLGIVMAVATLPRRKKENIVYKQIAKKK